MLDRRFLAFSVLLLASPVLADGYGPPDALPPPPIAPLGLHYAPAENLERIDVAVLDRAVSSIDMAAFVLTDWPVIDALSRAAARGVTVRVLLDRREHELRPEVEPLVALHDLPNVRIRISTGRALMHLKSYAVDGQVLRTGSANFSAAGLTLQDNDLLLLASPGDAAHFANDFARAFADGRPE